ncbi:hypothetical protein COLO4_22587 [Corchorus olitorius]|uniref:Uncharacterized protein n=1 Tax=Corchorus olitorius TaxID=93759 RepID=A0A1R3ILB2_9ROSI|nr:hypothetical protein COLO4_22587 [Corchorus olitorius]
MPLTNLRSNPPTTGNTKPENPKPSNPGGNSNKPSHHESPLQKRRKEIRLPERS